MANLTELGMLEQLDGYLLVDKPAGLNFASVVKTVKKLFNLVKVGHGGSLEAMASGLMVLLVGDANRFSNALMGADREYEGTMRFDRRTTTGDVQGPDSSAAPSGAAPADLSEFKGDVFQTEPRFAAIRKEGTAGYEIVDTGEHQQFLTHVYRLELNDGAFQLKSQKGLIVRALADDMGGCLATLRRTAIGKFRVGDAIPFENLLQMSPSDFAAAVKPLYGNLI